MVTEKIVARLSGLPAQSVEALSSAALNALTHGILALEARIAVDRESVSTTLHDEIGRVEDKSARNSLIKLRRDLYCGRHPTPRQLAESLTVVASLARSAIETHVALLHARDDALAQFGSMHCTESLRTRCALQDAVADQDFLKGLLASSVSLFQNVARYRRQDPKTFVSRDEHIERGLLRYLTRAARKATPFATFCSVVPVRLVPDAPRAFSLVGDTSRKLGAVRLNKSLLGVILSHLRLRPAVRIRLPIEVNPTLTRDGSHLRFLASMGAREVFQRLPASPVIDLIIGTAYAERCSTLEQLAQRLAGNPQLETTPDEALRYLDSLLSFGLFRYGAVVPELEADWDRPLRALLCGFDDAHARAVHDMLGQARHLLELYGASDVDERAKTCDDLRATITSTLETLGLRAKIPRDLPLFEDVTLAAEVHIRSDDALRRTLEVVDTVASTLSIVAGARPEHISMRHYFESKYGANATVSVLQFYEDYYRDHFRQHAARAQTQNASHTAQPAVEPYDVTNPFGLESIEALKRATQALQKLIVERCFVPGDPLEVSISLADIRSALNDAPAVGRSTFRSVSAFCQLMPYANGWRCVLSHPRFHTGFGKYFSRFLYILPPDLHASLLRDNRALTEDIIAEISGDAYFNANLHPPLVDCQISHPSGDGSDLGEQLPVAGLDIRAVPDDPFSLQLVRRLDGRRVHALDLGFLSSQLRPPLFQLLGRLTQGMGSGIPLMDPSCTIGGQPLVVRRPRIVIEDVVVVARQSWFVPHELFPAPAAGESPSDLFLRVQRWRHSHDIPERVFVRVVPLASRERTDERSDGDGGYPGVGDVTPLTAATGASDRQRSEASGGASPTTSSKQSRVDGRSRDFRKPQFIDFSSPLLVSLFTRIPSGFSCFRLAIEEQYPDATTLPSDGLRTFAFELVTQLDSRKGECTGGTARVMNATSRGNCRE